MTPFLGELLGTAALITLGNGVVANVVLNKTKGNNGGWIVISFGWGVAVFVGVYISSPSSGGHLNPAITLAFAALGKLSWNKVPVYLLGQMLGAMAGSFLVWITYKDHYTATQDADAKMATFCTSPAIRNPLSNLFSEVLGTFVLVFGALHIVTPSASLGAIDALPVCLLVLGIGLSLGGTTGYAINPARDLGPRIMHFLLPVPGKRNSDWAYAWIPIVGPLLGAILAAAVFHYI